ncbi:TIGR04076 family protein [bacterium]|nr:TIGR04076 family protein [bacterium]
MVVKILIEVKEIRGLEYCKRVKVGQKWVYPQDLNGICPSALNTMLPVLFSQRFGAIHPQSKYTGNKDNVLLTCPDALRPVVYSITRIEEEDKPSNEYNSQPGMDNSMVSRVLIEVKETQGTNICDGCNGGIKGHEVGDKWTYPDDLSGLCLHALNSILPALYTIGYGGTHPQSKYTDDEDTLIETCPDALRTVVFTLKRLKK